MSCLQRECRSFRDLDAVQRWAGGRFPARRFRGDVVDGSGPLMRSISTTAEGFSFIDTEWNAPGAGAGGTSELAVLTGGGPGYRVSHAGRAIDSSGPLLAPSDGFEMEWEARRSSSLILSMAGVERIARTATGDHGLVLRRTGIGVGSPELAAHWSSIVQGVRRELRGSPEAFDSPMIMRATFHRLATAFLHAFPTNWLDAAGEPSRGSAVVRAALEYMHAHAGDPITVTDVANATFITTRGLHGAFTKELGESPSRVLRRIRLDGARVDLGSGDPDATLAAVAQRWGFTNVPRFVAAYRSAHGEPPLVPGVG
ncbi:helix-turn-helix transcriptional regulator [Agromyces sp. MMS24-K17]|uniref:helix-turn-helix transcriptional regulator n=1 Tax=Agromyces sp. MMS24-K17 TaxID=3372850 RepID=UPI003754C4D0